MADGCRMPVAEKITITESGRSAIVLACSEHYFDHCWGQLKTQLRPVPLSA